MGNNYFWIAWRYLTNNKRYSIINMGGLAIGMAVSMLLLLYVYNEYNFDRFNVNSDRLYLVFKNQSANGEIKTKAISPEPLAPALKKDLPEIDNVARTSLPADMLISYKDKGVKVSTIAADPSLLDMFTFDLVDGDKDNALSGQSSIVITQSVATAIFGKENPIGQVIKLNNEFPLTVSAVIKDNSANSSLSFKAVFSWQSFVHQQPWVKEAGWSSFYHSTYVLLKPKASLAAVNAKMGSFLKKYSPGDKEIRLFLYPLTRQHLYNEFQNGINTGGRIEYVRLFLTLAVGILLIACINFMNLATARSAKRAREVGVRKAIGARRGTLIQQFLAESLVMAFLAFILALVFLLLLLPVFNRIIGIQLSLPYDKVWAWTAALGITVFTGLLAGSYPALFLSSFSPIKVLKGQLTTARTAARPRQLLVITQFTFAICLILFSIFVFRQINFIKDRPVGYERNGLVEMPLDGKLSTLFERFRREAIDAGAITDAAVTSTAITDNRQSAWSVLWPGQLPGEDKIPIDCIGVTWHFISTYGLVLSQGRDFDPARPADSNAVLLNEAAVQMMRLQDPVGKEITWMGSKRSVIGVVKDFVWGSPYESVKPAVIGFMSDWAANIGLRLNPNASVSKSLSSLQTIYGKYNPEYPFGYTFTNENFSKKFSDEKLLGSISLGFTSLAIFISCLGLFGLASFSAEQRRKEIGVRKVLGAGVVHLWFKLSQEFIKLIAISFIIGSAVSWYYIHHWLSRYTFHASFTIWIFLATLAVCTVLCLAAVSWQAIRAANANPVDSLRSE